MGYVKTHLRSDITIAKRNTKSQLKAKIKDLEKRFHKSGNSNTFTKLENYRRVLKFHDGLKRS